MGRVFKLDMDEPPVEAGPVHYWHWLKLHYVLLATAAIVLLISKTTGEDGVVLILVLTLLAMAGAAVLYGFFLSEWSTVEYKTHWAPMLWFVVLMGCGLGLVSWLMWYGPAAAPAKAQRREAVDSYLAYWSSQGLQMSRDNLSGGLTSDNSGNDQGLLHLGTDRCRTDFDVLYDPDHTRVMVVVSVTVDGEERLQDLTYEQVRTRYEQVCPKGA